MTKKNFKLLLLIILFLPFLGFSQNEIPKHVSVVFNDLVNAYGSIKIPPSLELSKPNENVVALYLSNPKPTVKIDSKLLKICSELGKDSLSALALILSHELAHYYNDHTFCYDFAFAHKNSTLSKNLIQISSDSKKEKEIQADYQGLWHTLMAGYVPILVFDKTFDSIYRNYELPDIMPGYPTKVERKQLKNTVLLKIEKLAPIFNSGLILSQNFYFKESKDCFEYLLQTLPTEENFNNAGMAYLSLALNNQTPESIPFLYPIYNDNKSFLVNNNSKNGSKGLTAEDEAITQQYFKMSKKYFEKAINLNPTYLDAIFNLASLYSIVENQEASLGLLNSLPKENKQNEKAILIRAIANFKLNNEIAAEALFEQLKDNENENIQFNYQLFKLSQGPKTILNKFLITQRNLDLLNLQKGSDFEFDTKGYFCQNIADLKVCNNTNQNQILIQIDKSTNLYCKLIQGNWTVSTK